MSKRAAGVAHVTLPVVLILCGAARGLEGHATEAATREATNATLAGLRARWSAIVSQPQFTHAAWGIRVESLDTGQVVFEHDSGRLLLPASNAKLFTGALALDRLGPDFRIRTSCYTRGKPTRSGRLRGELVVYGRGDFSFAAGFNDGDHERSLAPLVGALEAAGVRRIQGDLVGDATYFRGPPLGTGWAWDDLEHASGAEVSALTVEDNVVNLRVRPAGRVGDPCAVVCQPPARHLRILNHTVTGPPGGRRDIRFYRPPAGDEVWIWGQLPAGDTNWVEAVSVPRPALWFVTLLRERLAQRGIVVSGKLRTVAWPEGGIEPPLVEIATVESPPLRELLVKTLKPSQNQYAQLLLLQVGAAREHESQKAERGRQKAEVGGRMPESVGTKIGFSQPTTEALGLAELGEFLREAGIDSGSVLLSEGSGLSRGARVTPEAIVRLLRFMDHHRHRGVFREALPIAGRDGTLRQRMKGTAAEGNVIAKTGTLRRVCALSGYVTSTAREHLVFSLMLNNDDLGTEAARVQVDALVVMLAELAERSNRP